MSTRGWEHATVEDTRPRRAVVSAKPSKYKAARTTVDGLTFHSAAEAHRYTELKLLEKAGEIRELVCQPRYPLMVGAVLIGHFVADFAYVTAYGAAVTEDVKGGATLPLAKWKQKHLKAQLGIVVQEVR